MGWELTVHTLDYLSEARHVTMEQQEEEMKAVNISDTKWQTNDCIANAKAEAA